MPFDQLFPRPFTSGAIQTYAPASPGVYGLSNAREWIFIGETDSIREALLDHLQNNNTTLMKRQPAGFVYEVCEGARRVARLNRLVHEYGPTCNGYSSR